MHVVAMSHERVGEGVGVVRLQHRVAREAFDVHGFLGSR